MLTGHGKADVNGLDTGSVPGFNGPTT
jgi:hypothetical protein